MYDYALPALQEIICFILFNSHICLTVSAQTPAESAAKAKRTKKMQKRPNHGSIQSGSANSNTG